MADTVGAAHSFRGRDSNQCSSSRGEQENPTITHGAARELVEADNQMSPQIVIIVIIVRQQQHKQQKQKQVGFRA